MGTIILFFGILCFANSIAIIHFVKNLDRQTDCIKDYVDLLAMHIWDDINALDEKINGEAKECPMQSFYEAKQAECKAHNGNCKECNMGCDIEED